MTNGSKIALLGAGDEDAYERFLAEAPGATIYHSLVYRNLLVAMLAPEVEYALVWRGERIVGVLPLMGQSGSAGTVLNSLPFFGSYGDILALDCDARDMLAGWFLERLERGDVAAATLISNPFDPDPPFAWSTAASDVRIAQFTPLPDGPDRHAALLDLIDGSARRNIRKAEKAGVTVKVDNDAFAFLEECHCENMATIGGRAKPAAFFAEIPRTMRADHDYRIYVAEHDGQPVAAILLFYHGRFVEYITPVTRPGSRDLQPTAALLHRAMTDAIDDGRQVWNWGGTWLAQDGVYRFKRKWGADERRYSYATFLPRPAITSLSPDALWDEYRYYFIFPFPPLP